MAIKDTVTKEITKLGEAVRVYNSTQTLDTDTDYGSIAEDDYVDGTYVGTAETAVIQPANKTREQEAEGRITEGEMFGVFKENSVITNNSLVKVIASDYLYKVKSIETLRVSGVITHYECMLEFVEDLSP